MAAAPLIFSFLAQLGFRTRPSTTLKWTNVYNVYVLEVATSSVMFTRFAKS